MKKIFRILVACITAAALLVGAGVCACAAEQVEGDFVYRINDDGLTVTITEYIGAEKVVYIPQTIDGKSVTAIGDEAFLNGATIKEIVFPTTIESIGNKAMYGCLSLVVIEIPSVCTIGSYAFFECGDLISVSLSERVTSIGANAFSGCYVQELAFDGAYDAWVTLKEEAEEGNEALFNATFTYISGLDDGPFPRDVNDDGEVDMLDVLLAYQMAAGTLAPTRLQNELLDVNRNNRVDMSDVLRFYNDAAGNVPW